MKRTQCTGPVAVSILALLAVLVAIPDARAEMPTTDAGTTLCQLAMDGCQTLAPAVSVSAETAVPVTTATPEAPVAPATVDILSTADLTVEATQPATEQRPSCDTHPALCLPAHIGTPLVREWSRVFR